ncbi:energy-coupling factor transporter transmembrane component T family protein [Thermanaeromonas sp. C210]|uniref:energy-coupling factor transporter transmembrane component T family protein n=1 Tax=Thermanaeromonas sp. C210 TaxID=2731925 RepID=UPI00155B9146|nr:energy-coupling factor transporter transmembrane component T [Thermanaeromonas sp. C210]GFN23015.1 cobalt transporter [Thermanaeromonas sp. C210]
MTFELGRYVPGRSFLHRLDPRSKIGGLFLYGVALLAAPNLGSLFALGSLSLAGVFLAHLSWRYLWQQMKPVLLFLLIVVALQATLTPGTPWSQVGPLVVTREGLELGLVATGRVGFLLVAATLLTATTTPLTLARGIQHLLRPTAALRVPVDEISLMFTLALRFVPTLVEEADRVLKAQAARGLSLERRGIIGWGKNFLPFLIPLFVGTLKRAEDLAQAMEARCYQAGRRRGSLEQLKMVWQDYAFLVLCGILAGLALALRWI